ncbi:hypothetical protein K435DRAFT_616491, partial [Dendrothele bispora CBS 962.96]
KLNDSNYASWAMMMEAELIRKDLWDNISSRRLQKSRTSISRGKDSTNGYLSNVHHTRGFSTALSMQRKFLTMKKTKTQKMSAWIGEVKAQAFEMEEVGLQVTDLDMILLTMGLPSSFDGLIIQLDATPYEDLTVDHVATQLLSEETHQ